jgi:DNA primase
VNSEQLKEIPILTVASRLGIEMNNKNVARCLKNEDTNPSFNFFPNKNNFKCFSCGAQGSTIDLVMHTLDLPESKDAMRWLNNEFNGAGGGITTIKRQKRAITPAKGQATIRDYHYIYDDLLNQGQSFSEMPTKSQDYFTRERKLSAQIVKAWEIKYYSEEKRNSIFKYLKDKYRETDLIESGVFGISKKGKPYYTFFDCSYLFPFWDQVKFFHIQGRSNTRKYVNLAKTIEALKPYGYHVLSVLKPGDTVYMCEGLMDCLTLNDHDFKAIGIPGVNNFKSHYAQILKPYNVIFIRDNDPAGKQLENKICKTLYHYKTKPIPEEYKDINNYLRGIK